MKKAFMSAGALALGVCVLAGEAPRAFAQAPGQVQPPGQAQEKNQARDPAQAQDKSRAQDRSRVGATDDTKTGPSLRISELTGTTIKNMQGENVGTVNDIVIESPTGEMRYVAVSYGGFLGLGNKLFAVPWKAFECQIDEESKKCELVLNVQEQQMKSAPGFDQSDWPNFGDKEFTSKLDAHYKTDRLEGDQPRDGEKSQLKEVVPSAAYTTIRASELTGMTVQNLQGENVGTVNDVVIEAQAGKVRYMAVSYGGFLGLGNKLFAVPWKSFKCQRDQDSEKCQLIINVQEQRMKTAPGFDQNNWPDFGDKEFTSKLDAHYEIEPRETDE